MDEPKRRRRKSNDGGRRTSPFCITVTDTEKRLLTTLSAKAGRTRTEYILSCTVYADTFPVLPPQDELRALWRELSSQGANLNQIAAAMNRLAKAADRGDVDPDEIHDLVEETRRLVAECREEIWGALRRAKDLLARGSISGRRA